MSFEKKKSSKYDRIDALMKSLDDGSIKYPKIDKSFGEALSELSGKTEFPWVLRVPPLPDIPSLPPIPDIPPIVPIADGIAIDKMRSDLSEAFRSRLAAGTIVPESIFYGLKIGDICGVMLTHYHSILLFQFKRPTRVGDKLAVEFVENSDRLFPDSATPSLSTPRHVPINHEDVFIREKVLQKLFPTFYEEYKKDMI